MLVFFCASWCTPCHHLENDLRNQPGAVAALEANFVPVKINYDYYPNTAKQYGVTRLPTTVILAPNAQGDVLAVIPEYMPVDQYLSKLNKVAADAKRRDAGVFAQIQPSPPVGLPPRWVSRQLRAPVPPAIPSAVKRRTRDHRQCQNPCAARFTRPDCCARPAAQSPPPSPMLAMATGPGLPAVVRRSAKPAEIVKPPANPLFGLDGFCPVQLVENARWQPGKKAWGAIHRGRTYLFAGPEEQRRFLADPDRYAPVSSGDDVVLLLEQGRSVSGCREHGLQFDGHVYLFAGEGTLEKFRSNPHYYADRALQALRRAAPYQAAIVR